MNAERVIAITRDVGCITLSLTGIAWQQYTGNVNPLLLGAYMALLGIPVGVNARQMAQQAGRVGRGRGTGGTHASSSSPLSVSPSSSSSSALDPEPEEGGA